MVKKAIKIICFLLLFLILTLLLYFFINKPSEKEITKKVGVEKVVKINPICTRKERLSNSPQYDRALSLIKQRIDEQIEIHKKSQWKDPFIFFDSNLTNCIVIIEKDFGENEDVEGYFKINDASMRNDYFPITVNKKYNETDDVTTAILIVHEMAHVQQYLNTLKGENSLDCVKSEVEAFLSQWNFFTQLNTEEVVSVNARNEYYKESHAHPQVEMIGEIQGLLREYARPACGFMETVCDREVLRVQLKWVIRENEYYKKQCGIK